MSMGHHQQTATILPFPSRAERSDLKGGFGARLGRPSGHEAKTQQVAHPALTDSWYHQAAIEEAAHTRKP